MATSSVPVNFFARQDPSYVLQELQVQRAQKIADMLTAEGNSPIEYDHAGKISPLQGLAKMLQAYGGRTTANDAIEGQAKLVTRANQIEAGQFGVGRSPQNADNPPPQPPSTASSAPVDSAPVQSSPGGAQVSSSVDNSKTVGPSLQGADTGMLGPDYGHEDRRVSPDPKSLASGLAQYSEGDTGNGTAVPSASTLAAPGGSASIPPAAIAKALDPQASLQTAQAAGPAPAMVSNTAAPQPARNPLVIPGMTNEQAYMAYKVDPSAYISEMIKRTDNRTDFSKSLLAMGMDPSTGVGRNLMGQFMNKQLYIAPENAKAGGWSIYPDGRKVWNPDIPKGGVPAYDRDGNFIGTLPMSGATGVTQGQNKAEAAGKSAGTLHPTVNPDGSGSLTQGTDFMGEGSQGGAQSGVNAGRFGGYAAVGGGKPITSLPTGSNDLASAGAKRYNELQTLAQDSPTRVNVQDNILQLSKDGVLTGPNQEWSNKVKGMFADTPVIGPKLAAITGTDAKSDAARYSEIVKFMNQNAQRAWQAAGGTGTDAQLEASTQANVNSKMFPQAVQEVALWNKGGELAMQAKARASQQWRNNGGTPLKQDQFETAWRENFDPRLYQMRAIGQFDPNKLGAFVSKLQPKEAATLKQHYDTAVQNGWMQ